MTHLHVIISVFILNQFKITALTLLVGVLTCLGTKNSMTQSELTNKEFHKKMLYFLFPLSLESSLVLIQGQK